MLPSPLGNFAFRKSVLALAACLIFVGEAQAKLRWENPTIEYESKIGEKITRTAFKFTNVGKSEVTITDVLPSCGCVATALDKFAYAPGESGEIQVTFDLEMDDSVGLQKRTIKVITSDAPKNPTVLKLRITVPETIGATPNGLEWERGEKPKAKEVVLQASPRLTPIKLTQANENSDFLVEIKTEIEGQRYRVKFTPKVTDQPCFAQLEFVAVSAALDRPTTCEVNAVVK